MKEACVHGDFTAHQRRSACALVVTEREMCSLQQHILCLHWAGEPYAPLTESCLHCLTHVPLVALLSAVQQVKRACLEGILT